MRALMQAANGGNSECGAQNDANMYVSNRAKLREQKQKEEEEQIKLKQSSLENKKNGSTKVSRPNLSKNDEKVDRKAAQLKISQTFGYGEGPKAPPITLLSAKERQAEKKQQQKTEQPNKTNKQNAVPEMQKAACKMKLKNNKSQAAKLNKSSNISGQKKDVEKWDFKPTSSTAHSRLGLSDIDSAIDPELDGMLAELELDSDFQQLDDNAQLTW